MVYLKDTLLDHHGERANEPQSENDEMEGEFVSEEGLKSRNQSDDEIDEMIRDLFPLYHGVSEQGSSSNADFVEEPNEDAKRFYRLLKDFEQPAYPCLLYTSPSPRDGLLSRMPSSA